MAPSPETATSTDKPALVQHMGLLTLTLYGVGDMLGTGVYGLIGKFAGAMGNAIWLAYAVSMVAAMLTGLSYACLGSRYPKAAGAAFVTHRAFGSPMLAYVLGLAVVASGLTSMATASHAFTNHLLSDGAGLPARYIVIAGFIAVLTLVNFWGIRESTWLNLLCTCIEVGGLLLVVMVGLRFWGGVNYLEVPPPAAPAGVMPDPAAVGAITLPLVLSGGVLTFYAFVGFEDMLNVSEEVKNPRRTFPLAMVLALVIVTIIYMAVAITAVSVMPWRELSQQSAPLAAVAERAAPWIKSEFFRFVALFAIANTALLNYIMGSRLVYGMARQGMLPAALGSVHARRRTPHVAIFVLMALVLALALPNDIKPLAAATSVLLLMAFMVVNAGLVALKFRKDEPRGGFEVPVIVPIGGILVCGVMVANGLIPRAESDFTWAGYLTLTRAYLIAAGLLALIVGLYVVLRPKNVVEA